MSRSAQGQAEPSSQALSTPFSATMSGSTSRQLHSTYIAALALGLVAFSEVEKGALGRSPEASKEAES